MLLWVPSHVTKERILSFLSEFHKDTFRQILQDRIHSRFPSFTFYKIYVDSNFEEIDTKCAICLEDADYQLNACGHIFHKRCITAWKKKNRTCPLCRAPI